MTVVTEICLELGYGVVNGVGGHTECLRDRICPESESESESESEKVVGKGVPLQILGLIMGVGLIKGVGLIMGVNIRISNTYTVHLPRWDLACVLNIRINKIPLTYLYWILRLMTAGH